MNRYDLETRVHNFSFRGVDEPVTRTVVLMRQDFSIYLYREHG